MPYPNSNILNVVIPQTSGSFLNGQAPFIERIISGSNLILQTDSTGLLIGSSDVTINNITTTNISASGNITASNLWIKTNITDAGSLNVLGNSTLTNTFVTNLTASNISASGQVTATGFSGSLYGTSSWATDSVNSTNVNISSINTNATHYVTFVDGTTGNKSLKTDIDILSYNPLGNSLSLGNTSGSVLIGGGAGQITLSNIYGTNASLSVGSIVANEFSTFSVGNVAGGENLLVSIGGGSSKISTNLPITSSNATQANSWTEGSIITAGGVGIGKNLYVSGSTWLYGDLTLFGSSSIVYISSSQVIINDNIIQLNAYSPFERYAGIEVYDSGSNQRSASLLWDGNKDNWITVDQNNSSSNIIVGPTASFGTDPGILTSNFIPKAYDDTGITNSKLSDDGTTLSYTGTTISSSRMLTTTSSFSTATIITGSSPGVGNVPAHPTSSGMPGQFAVDNNYFYIYSNNIWKRIQISNWNP